MEKLREFETFESVSEMDNFVSEVLVQVELNKTERELLWLLAGHSVKFIGVSFLKLTSMAEKLGKSKKTIQRALKTLSELGIIKRVRTLRPSRGGFGASLTLICPIDLTTRKEASEPAPEQSERVVEQTEAFTFKAYLKDLKDIRQPEINELDYSYITEFVPEAFSSAVKPFISAEEAYSLWSKAQVVASKYAPDVYDLIEPAIRAFKASVFAYKNKSIKKSFGAYFWGTLRGIFGVEQRRVSKDMDILGYNWLENC